MTQHEKNFLRRLIERGGEAYYYQLATLSPDENRARQGCRRRGWAEFMFDRRRWRITDSGRAALNKAMTPDLPHD